MFYQRVSVQARSNVCLKAILLAKRLLVTLRVQGVSTAEHVEDYHKNLSS